MGMATSGAFLVARSELRTRTALVLEAIALRHEIGVLTRNRTRRPCLGPSDRLLWILLSQWGIRGLLEPYPEITRFARLSAG